MSHSRLLVRLPNWVGDVIMCLPAINLLQTYGITPILFGKPWIHHLLEGLELPLYTWPQSTRKILNLLRSFPEQSMLLYPNSFSSAFYARLAGKSSIGFSGDSRKYMLSRSFTKPKLDYEAAIFYHLTHAYLKSQGQTKIPYDHRIIPKLNLRSESLTLAKTILNTHKVPDQFYILCPFAHGVNRQKQSKKWPYWQELCDTLPPKSYVICPGPNEQEEAYQSFPKAIILENIPLNIYGALCQLAGKVVANDSGPMHISAAVGSPTLALFGATDPKRAAPRNVQVLGEWHRWPSLEQVLNAMSSTKNEQKLIFQSI